MKTNNRVKNVLKNGISVIVIISSFIIMLQLNKSENNVQLAIQELNQEIANVEKTNDSSEQKAGLQVTSRYSSIRTKNEHLQHVIKKQEEIIIEEPYTRIEDISISRDMDLSIRTGLSKEDFKVLISNVKYDTSKFFYDNSDLIYDMCEKYQINEIFFCGLISAESGWNIASNHRRTYNYISLMTKGGLIPYGSVEEGLEAAAKALHNNYLTEGGRFYNGKTLYGVKTRFCPASSTWVELVYGRMQQIIKCR